MTNNPTKHRTLTAVLPLILPQPFQISQKRRGGCSSKLKTGFFAVCLLLGTPWMQAQNQAPQISNVALQINTQDQSYALQYELSDAENDPMEVSIQFSTDGGKTYQTLSGAQVTGDVGYPVAAGARAAVCTGLNVTGAGAYFFRVIADDRQPFDLQALVDEVDSVRLRQNLEFVEGVRHRTAGLAHLNATRDSIMSLFESLGLVATRHTFPFSNTTGENLVGSLPGTVAGDTVVIVDAHYDTVSNAPGADDNGSGTVGMMEVARLLSRYPAKKTQRYIGFDLEESGLIGSNRYVTSGIGAGEKIAGVFNFEMIGYWSNEPNSQELPTGFGLLFPLQAQQVADNQYRGDFITNVGNTNSAALALLYSSSAQQYVPGLKVITLQVPGNGAQVPDLRRSDHASFWDAGYRALMLSDGANFRNECYHTAGDTLDEKLNFTFMSQVVKATLASVAQLAEIQHAGWATASFVVTTGTQAPDPCQFKIFSDQRLNIQSECPQSALQVAVYDLKGSLLLNQAIDLPEGGSWQLNTDQLPTGTYILKITHAKGVFSEQVFIRH